MKNYRMIKQSTAKHNIDNNSNIIILDVRRPDEYVIEHIPNSINIPNYEISNKAHNLLTDKDAIIYVHCKTGGRSYGAVLMLIDMGYNNVYNMGGIITWPFKTTKE